VKRIDAYSALGLPPDASHAQIHAAFRTAAKRLHPDRNPDPHAEEEFKRALHARDIALGRVRSRRRRSSHPPPPPRRPRFRHECPRCDDSYAYAGTCPRCAIPLHDLRGPARPPLPEDPRVTAMIALLELRAARPEPTAPSPRWLTVLACSAALCGWGVAQVGLFPLTAVLLGYGLLIAGLDMYDRFVPPLPVAVRAV